MNARDVLAAARAVDDPATTKRRPKGNTYPACPDCQVRHNPTNTYTPDDPNPAARPVTAPYWKKYGG